MTEGTGKGMDSQATQAYILEECKRRSPGDYYFFVKAVLGHHMRNQGRDIHDHVHRPFCDAITRRPFGKNRTLVLAPRGSLKSTVVTEGYPLWRFIKAIEAYLFTREPQILSVLITSHSLVNAKKFLRKIKGHFTSNELFRACFMLSEVFPKGDWVPDPRDPNSQEEWTKEEIRLIGKGVEFSIEVASVDRACEGQHYDIIIADDLHDIKNTKTRTGIDEVIAYIKSLVPLGHHGAGTDRIFIGTRWRQDDAYDWLMKHWKFSEKRKNLIVFRAINSDGSLWFPEFLTAAKLKKYKEWMSPYEFSAQYMNDPVPPEDQYFHREWIHELEKLPYQDADSHTSFNFNTYMAVDPGGPNEGNDKTAIVVVKANQRPYNHIYVVAAEADNWTDDVIVEKIFWYARLWGVQVVGIEDNNFARRLKRDVLLKLGEGKIRFRVQPLRYAGRDKPVRIAGLQTEMANNRLFFVPSECKHHGRLMEEILGFRPDRQQPHDDLVDALAYTLDLVHPASPAKPHNYNEDFSDLLSKRETYMDGWFWKNFLAGNAQKKPHRRKVQPAWAR